MFRNAGPMFKPVPLRPQLGRKMGQGLVSFDPKVDFRPDVKVPINVELGALPLSVGMFLGAGLAFLIRPQLSEGFPKTAALVVGAGLAVAGITNLMLPKAQAAPAVAVPGSTPTTTAPTAPSAPGGGVSAPPGVTVSDESLFAGVSGQVTYPGEGESVNIWPLSSSYPIRVQLYNPAAAPVTFYLQIVANESPLPFGKEARTTFPMQVTVGPAQTRDIDINMPITTWAWDVKYVDIALSVYKQRMAGENPVLMAQRYLVVN
jgi:hypothetical protein